MAETLVAFGPGRVNLIGEHTDYNDGLAMPFAIERGVTVTATPAKRWSVDALDLGERDEFKTPDRKGWRAFAAAWWPSSASSARAPRDLRRPAAGQRPLVLRGARSGARARSDRASRSTGKALAKLCSKVENDWVGAETGLLDQFASLLSQPAHVLRIDFRSLDVEPHPLISATGSWSRSIPARRTTSPASGYNERRAECRAACEALGIDSLRDATDPSGWTARCCARARHVISENERVDATARALDADDLQDVAELLDARTPRSATTTRRPCPRSRRPSRLKSAGAAGARMVGGGFGGSVLALLGPGVAPLRRRPRRHPRRPRPPAPRSSSSPSGRVNAHSRIPQPEGEHPKAREQVDVHPAAFSISSSESKMPRITSSRPQAVNTRR